MKLSSQASAIFTALLLASLLSCICSLYLTLAPLSTSRLPSSHLDTGSSTAFLLSSRALLLEAASVTAPLSKVRQEKERETELSIYSVPNLCNKWQSIWIYKNLCYNGSHMLTLGESVKCREAKNFAAGGAVTPAPCGSSLYDQRRRLRPEIKIPEAHRPVSWLASREKVEWRRGTSSVIYLDNTVDNVAHFIGKVNMLLAMNNASVPALTEVVGRFMFYYHEQVWRQSKANREAFHPTYLAMLLSRVLAPLGGKPVEPGDLLSGGGVQEGRIEMEAPFAAASEEQPLCFETAILPGFLKRSFWPGGLPAADIVREHLVQMLGPPPESDEPSSTPVLLYVVRRVGWRVFFPATEARFGEMLRRQGMAVRIADFQAMKFREQFWSVQRADVTISLHGANLVNPSMFSRKNSVLIEIVPFHIVHRMYESQAIDSGLIYMSHQCEQGKSQRHDHLYDSYTYQDCIDTPACKKYFLRGRRIELTTGDFYQLEKLLSLAQTLVRRMNSSAPSSRVESFLEEGVPCLPYAERDNHCRRTWIAWNDGQGSRICYFNEVCGQFPVRSATT